MFYNNASEKKHVIPGELFCPSTSLFVDARHKYVKHVQPAGLATELCKS